MTVEVQKTETNNVVEIHLSGKLTKEDYSHFVPEMEALIQEWGKIRVLMVMKDFHGWSLAATWEDLKFDFKHYADIERIAMVGDKKWQKGMATVCKPFTKAKIRYFGEDEMSGAHEWIEEDAPTRTMA